MLGNFSCIWCRLQTFLQNNLSPKIPSGTQSGCQTVWIQIRTDIMSVLIWVQMVCKGYQQMTKVTASKERVNPQSANRNKSRLLFSSAEMFKKPLWQTVWTQIILLLIGAVWSGSNLFASVLKFVSNVRQLFAADVIFQMHFFLVL